MIDNIFKCLFRRKNRKKTRKPLLIGSGFLWLCLKWDYAKKGIFTTTALMSLLRILM